MANDLLQITLLSLYVTGASTALSSSMGIPIGTFLGLREFGGKVLVKNLLFTLYGLPPVLAGLLVFLLLSRQGPLGVLNWVYTPIGMVVAQCVIITPIIAGVTTSAVSTMERRVKETAITLGADTRQIRATAIRQAGAGIVTAVMVGFGRAVSEVGAVLIVGGNIEGHTRVLTTTIILDISQANFAEAIVLGAILLVLAAAVYFVLYRLQEAALE